jgi:hypothetical protein
MFQHKMKHHTQHLAFIDEDTQNIVWSLSDHLRVYLYSH